MSQGGDDLLHQEGVLTGSDGASGVRPVQPASQLDELAWLATQSLNMHGALITLDQDGDSTPGASFGLQPGDILRAIELCRHFQDGEGIKDV